MLKIDPAKYTILVVDDNKTNIILASTILKRVGYRILTATSGKEALELVEIDMPDLILLDIMMPEMDGYEVAKHLKFNENTKNIAIVFLTALTETKNEVRGFIEGANDYLHKPIKADILRARVLYLLEQIQYKRIIEQQSIELQKTIANRDKIYSIIAHDLRSPLATSLMIHNMLLLNLDKKIIGEEMHEMLEDANRITENTYTLLDNLLKWSKSQINRLKLTFQDIYISDMIDAMLEIINHTVAYKKLEIITDISDKILVSVDVDTVKTILRNLLSNAIKFSNEGGRIYIKQESDDKNVYLQIKDEGIGIKDEDKDKLFNNESFTTFGTKNEEGSGLGLFICKDFIEKNGGEISFESTYGEGTTFTISLPKATQLAQ